MVLRHLLFWLLLTITLYFFLVLVFPLEIPQIMAVLAKPSHLVVVTTTVSPRT